MNIVGVLCEWMHSATNAPDIIIHNYMFNTNKLRFERKTLSHVEFVSFHE